MLRHPGELPAEERVHMRDGEGTVTLAPALQPGDYQAALRLFSRITLPPGASIGYHVHEGEEELFYFIAGEGELDDNGIKRAVQAGDASVTRSGEGHALRNTGACPLVVLATIATL